jgi:septal ring factor EnvC (AmiA/AmiB activator)
MRKVLTAYHDSAHAQFDNSSALRAAVSDLAKVPACLQLPVLERACRKAATAGGVRQVRHELAEESQAAAAARRRQQEVRDEAARERAASQRALSELADQLKAREAAAAAERAEAAAADKALRARLAAAEARRRRRLACA